MSSKAEGVIVISSHILPSEHFVQKILDVETLPNATLYYSDIKGYPWHLETKYYSAEVILYPLTDKSVLDPNFCDSIKATVLCFDSKKLSSFEDVLSWMPFLQDIDSEVQLLVCNSCSDDCENFAPGRKNILKWCVDNHFELVELDASEESDDEEDKIFGDSRGYGRIIQALQTHTWANLVMKGEDNGPNNVLNEENNTEAKKEAEDTEEKSEARNPTGTSTSESSQSESSKKIKVEDEELLLEDQWLANVLGNEDPDGQSFEALFTKFASMKDKASGLTSDERKKYAEKVAIAFWRAMGGDEEEIDGLDDD